MHINEMLKMLRLRYGRRNSLCFPHGLIELMLLFGQSVAKLNRAIRKNDSPETIGARLADAVAWLGAVINHFDDLPFAEALIAKYGKMKCPYCDERHCTCESDNRPEIGEIVIDEFAPGSSGSKTLEWWCHHLSTVFGWRNQELGIDRILLHLVEEVFEVTLLTGIVSFEPNNLDKLEIEFALELSDVLAHLIATANLKKIDLVAAVQNRYGDHCPTCLMESCQCPRLIMSGDEVRRIGSVSVENFTEKKRRIG